MRCLTPVAVPGTTMYVPCGKCYNCAVNYSNAWALRIMHEASLHRDNCVVTLTYAETDGHLHYRDVQLFLKRLRKAIQPIRIRFFCCGEYYGECYLEISNSACKCEPCEKPAYSPFT